MASNKHMQHAEARAALPITAMKQELCDAIAQNQALVIIGETGSGKTTQLTQYLVELLGLSAPSSSQIKKMVGCTQPRRVAATSVAKRVAEEFGCSLGAEVGYTIRFEDCTCEKTVLKYMTDGMLVREYLADPTLNRYSALVLDEAHERSVHTDVLFGLLKSLLKQRKDLKLIVTSATLDAAKFAGYFGNCPVMSVPGRTYPVDVYHTANAQLAMTETGPKSSAYLKDAVELALKIHRTQEEGHILIFLTGAAEIDKCCTSLRSLLATREDDKEVAFMASSHMDVVPLYGLLPPDEQARAFGSFASGDTRKCVVATNIAETSVTVPGVRYVIDPGFVKQTAYDPSRGMESLVVVPISQVAAQQRAGRAGRTGPGQCFRLYARDVFNAMMPETVPEIQRSNLGSTVLLLKELGVEDVLNFDFFESPGVENLSEALVMLYALGALTSTGAVTTCGHQMAKLPLDPRLSRSLLQAHEEQCLSELLAVAAMLSAETIWHYPSRGSAGHDGSGNGGDNDGRRWGGDHSSGSHSRPHNSHRDDQDSEYELALATHRTFCHRAGDHFTLLNVWQGWEKAGFAEGWLRQHYLRVRAMQVARQAHRQLQQEVAKLKLPTSSCGYNIAPLVRSLVAGYFSNAARKSSGDVYRVLTRGLLAVGNESKKAPPFARLQASSSLAHFGEGSSGTRSDPSSSVRRQGAPISFVHVVFHELASSGGKPTLRMALAVEDDAWLDTCRRPMLVDSTVVNAETLCGKAPPPSAATPKDSNSNESGIPGSSGSGEQKRSASETEAAVNSARERFLARKRKKG